MLSRAVLNFRVMFALDIRGPSLAPATACTTGAHAIGDAFRYIKHGYADVMLCGGSEASVTPTSISLFAKIRALCPGTLCAASSPFMNECACFLQDSRTIQALRRDHSIAIALDL